MGIEKNYSGIVIIVSGVFFNSHLSISKIKLHSISIYQAHKTGIIAKEVVSKNMYFVYRKIILLIYTYFYSMGLYMYVWSERQWCLAETCCCFLFYIPIVNSLPRTVRASHLARYNANSRMGYLFVAGFLKCQVEQRRPSI